MAKVAPPEADVDAIRRFAEKQMAEWRDQIRFEVGVRGRSDGHHLGMMPVSCT
jgi:hypothetical protein